VRTVVNLREDAPASEARFGLEEIRIPLPPGSNVPTVTQVAELLAVLDEPRHMPCLVHCKVGADRTGIMVAAFRILRQGWSYDRALAEMEQVKGMPTTDLARERLLDVALVLRAQAPGSRTDQFRRLANAPLLAGTTPALAEP
jgi:protein-tyrosine phosphatase